MEIGLSGVGGSHCLANLKGSTCVNNRADLAELVRSNAKAALWCFRLV